MLKSWQLVMVETVVSGMVISAGLNVHRPVLFTAALLKPTVPKSVRGRTPPELQQGASAMTSAEDRAAPARVALMVCVQPAVLPVSVSRNWLQTINATLAGARSAEHTSELQS